jgi:hypothetical protein
MNTTHNTKVKLLATALGVMAAALVAPTLLFAGAGTAQADECPYDIGYEAGKSGGIGQCFENPSQQAQYDAGFADAQAGRQPDPFARDGVMPSINTDSPVLYPDGPPTTMGPFTGVAPEPGEFPEWEAPEPRGWDFDQWQKNGDGYGPWPVGPDIPEPEPIVGD